MAEFLQSRFISLAPFGLLFLWFLLNVAEALWRSDSMLERLYGYYRRAWVDAGAPRGWMWSPPGMLSNRGVDFLQHASSWSQTRPEWADLDPKLSRDFDRWLICYLRINGSLFIFLILTAFGGMIGVLLAPLLQK